MTSKEAIMDRWDNARLGETGDNELWKKECTTVRSGRKWP